MTFDFDKKIFWKMLSNDLNSLNKKISKRKRKLLKAEVLHKPKKVRKHERKLLKLLCLYRRMKQR